METLIKEETIVIMEAIEEILEEEMILMAHQLDSTVAKEGNDLINEILYALYFPQAIIIYKFIIVFY
jgi:hypothetical protein